MKFDKVIEEAEQSNKLNALKGFMVKEKQFQELFKDLNTLLASMDKVYKTIKENKEDVIAYINSNAYLGDGDPEQLPSDKKEIFDNVMNLDLLSDMLEDYSQIFAKLINQ